MTFLQNQATQQLIIKMLLESQTK